MTHCFGGVGGGVTLFLFSYIYSRTVFCLRNAVLAKVKIPCAIYRLALTDLERTHGQYTQPWKHVTSSLLSATILSDFNSLQV